MERDDGRSYRYQTHRHSALTIASNMGFIVICPSITLNPKTSLQAAPRRAMETSVSRNPATLFSLTTPHLTLCSYPGFSARLLNYPLTLYPITAIYPPAQFL